MFKQVYRFKLHDVETCKNQKHFLIQLEEYCPFLLFQSSTFGDGYGVL